MILRGLTLHRPWAAAIVHGPKRVENRTWAPPLALVRGGLTIAIHAGKRWDADGASDMVVTPGLWPDAKGRIPSRGSERLTAWPVEWTREGIVGTARVVDSREFGDTLGWKDRPHGDPWFVGPWGWVLDDVRALPAPIPCRGAQGLWRLPPAIETYLRTLAS